MLGPEIDMIRLIISILLFIILAVFVALNAQYTTTVDLFGYEFKQVSVAAVVTVTLAVGVLYSFTLYVSNFLSKARAERLKSQKRKNKEKATELAEKENHQMGEALSTAGVRSARGVGKSCFLWRPPTGG